MQEEAFDIQTQILGSTVRLRTKTWKNRHGFLFKKTHKKILNLKSTFQNKKSIQRPKSSNPCESPHRDGACLRLG